MTAFNCLARDCPLFGPHLLEASAGTGKTFSIEHIYVRLILEGVEVEQILAITFTRAATRELKARIRANLEKVLSLLQSGETPWEYLHSYVASEEAKRKVADALAGFDRCQIFTIHGFCYRMLKEFAFEAQMGFSLPDPDGEKGTPEKLRQLARDYLEQGISDLCPEQLALLFPEFGSLEEVIDRLVHFEGDGASNYFSAACAKCKAALHELYGAPNDASLLGNCIAALHLWGGALDEAKLLEDYRTLAPGYKVVKGDHEAQVKALAHLEDPQSIRKLIREKGSLFNFLDPANKKVRAKEPGFLHYPGFFDWARMHIAPLLEQKVLQTLQTGWKPIAEKVLSEEECFNPDEILSWMQKAVMRETFADRVRQKYRAAIIDEFQDTDAMQWGVFQRLFLEKPLLALYLVGDPKQSIYRFRKADVYTYLQARDFLGENHLYHLDTNFRSSKPLIGALNVLFQRNWLHLPKVNRTLPYRAVKAGAEIESSFPDQKGALHFLMADGEPNALFDERFLPYAVNEIEQLRLTRCAILVKDRYQAEKALNLLQSRGIPAVAKSHVPLGETEGFRVVRELFDAVLSPYDSSAAKVVRAGPFASLRLSFSEYRALLEEKGLVSFARAVLGGDSDVMQIFEWLFAWEKREGFSFEGLKRALQRLQKLKSDEGGARRMEVDEEAVQILTMHVSKGLEFDVVFALGLMTRTPEAEEVLEAEAEKLRQLYVALTRARKRLYVPIALSAKEAAPGTHSPMELFCRHLEAEGPLLERLNALSQSESITIESLTMPFSLASSSKEVKEQPIPSPLPIPPFTPRYILSFTALAQEKERKRLEGPTEGFTLQTIPRGAETGIAVHHLFESLFSAKKPIWRDARAIEALVEKELRASSLVPWKEVIQEMVKKVMGLPLQVNGEFFTLSELEPNQLQVESEFLFSSPSRYTKGFIDLLFLHRGQIYFLDWKTNYLENYDLASLEDAMEGHDYGLQADLYAEAIQRHFPYRFGGAFYLFVRGLASYYVQPR